MKQFIISSLFWLAVVYVSAVIAVGVATRPYPKDPCVQGSTRCNPRAH